MSYKINRKTYAQTYGPTKGDRVRLADTELIIEVEKDFTTYGDEVTCSSHKGLLLFFCGILSLAQGPSFLGF